MMSTLTMLAVTFEPDHRVNTYGVAVPALRTATVHAPGRPVR